MPSKRERVDEVEAAIEAALSLGRTRIEDVAQILFVSRSTLQRWLKPRSFTKVRQGVQLRIALKGLTSGRPVETVAREVALSRDHLRVIVREPTGLTPAEIARAARLGAQLKQWKGQVPPPAGTYAYRHRISEWNKADRKLQSILGDLDSSNPLAPWAKQLLLSVVRPDNRRRANRARIQEARKLEKQRLEERRKREIERLNALVEEAELKREGRSLLEESSLLEVAL
jgi:AraC-like DNA-binding protein